MPFLAAADAGARRAADAYTAAQQPRSAPTTARSRQGYAELVFDFFITSPSVTHTAHRVDLNIQHRCHALATIATVAHATSTQTVIALGR